MRVTEGREYHINKQVITFLIELTEFDYWRLTCGSEYARALAVAPDACGKALAVLSAFYAWKKRGEPVRTVSVEVVDPEPTITPQLPEGQ